jgi:predicted  nucleic acid-binding Zn-ribbon protein
MGVLVNKLVKSAKLLIMAARKSPANNHLQEAMALLIHNQAAFVEQIARNDQERLALQRKSDERELKSDAWRREVEGWQRRTEEWMRKSDERFARIETELHQLPKKIVQTVLDQLPRIKKEIGFKSPT